MIAISEIKECIKSHKRFCSSFRENKLSIWYEETENRLWMKIQPLGTYFVLEDYVLWDIEKIDKPNSLKEALQSVACELGSQFENSILCDIAEIEEVKND